MKKSIGCFQDDEGKVWVVGMMNRGTSATEVSFELVKMFDTRDSVKVTKMFFEGPKTEIYVGWSAEVKQLKEFDRDSSWEFAEVDDDMVLVRFVGWTEGDLGEIRERFQEVCQIMKMTVSYLLLGRGEHGMFQG